MRSALPQHLACSSIIVFFVCYASVTAPAKSKSVWMVESSNITICSKAATGGALVFLPVIGEPCLSKYNNILWMMSGLSGHRGNAGNYSHIVHLAFLTLSDIYVEYSFEPLNPRHLWHGMAYQIGYFLYL